MPMLVQRMVEEEDKSTAAAAVDAIAETAKVGASHCPRSLPHSRL